MSQRNRRFHGLLSGALVAGTPLFGALAIAADSPPLAVVYALIVVLCLFVVLYAFCTKCPARHNQCAHVVPGLLTRILPDRQPGRYNAVESLVVVAALAVVVLSPQYWLIRHPWLLAAFWVVALIGSLEIKSCVCPGCPNDNCPLRRDG